MPPPARATPLPVAWRRRDSSQRQDTNVHRSYPISAQRCPIGAKMSFPKPNQASRPPTCPPGHRSKRHHRRAATLEKAATETTDVDETATDAPLHEFKFGPVGLVPSSAGRYAFDRGPLPPTASSAGINALPRFIRGPAPPAASSAGMKLLAKFARGPAPPGSARGRAPPISSNASRPSRRRPRCAMRPRSSSASGSAATA